jgi:hypothetical protein
MTAGTQPHITIYYMQEGDAGMASPIQGKKVAGKEEGSKLLNSDECNLLNVHQ